jgi:hypothetical protein
MYTIAIFKKISEAGFSRKLTASLLGTGIIHPDIFKGDSVPFLLMFMRKGDKVEAGVIAREDGKEPIVNFDYIIEQTGMDDFDDVYFINFEKIKKEIDEKARKLIFDWWRNR